MRASLPILVAIQTLSLAWAMELTPFQDQISSDIMSNVKYAMEHFDVNGILQQTSDSVEYINTVVEIFKDGMANRRLQVTPNFPSHSGLDSECSNKLCNYMQYELSCQGIGINMDKICSSYLVGKMYSCSDFPTGEYEIYNAPSSCMTEYTGFLQMLMSASSGGTAMQTLINNYLFNPNFETQTCGRRCYQRFQTYSNDFLLTCQAQLNASKSSYPLVFGYSNFQQFRNQACNVNQTGHNCFHSFSGMASSGSSGAVSPFNMQCNYLNNPTQNAAVLGNMCASFSKFGCCAASGMQIIFANQMNSSNVNVWPPCLFNYFRDHCASINVNNYCSDGSVAVQSIFRGSFVIPANATRYINVYNKNSVLQAQGALIGMFTGAKPALKNQPFNLNSQYPFTVSITGFTYYNETNQLTPSTGIPAWPATSDFTHSTHGNFTYQVYLQNLSPTNATTFQTMVSNPNLYMLLANAFGAAPSYTVHSAANTYTYLPSAPKNVEHSAAAPRVLSMVSLAVATLATAWVLSRE